MLTIVFYATNGAAAKLRSRELVATRGNHIRVIDVSVWDDSELRCDAVQIMPDVPDWQRTRIEAVFGDKIVEPDAVEYDEQVDEADVKDPHRKQMGLMPPREETKKAVHRGGGRWFLMEGDQVISGPHDKAEAKRLEGEA